MKDVELKILLTGGAGFIGSHVADKLLKSGHEVTIIDNLITGKRSNLSPAATFIEMDIRDSSLNELWEQEQFELLIHFAAQMDVRKSVIDPAFDADVNIVGSIRLLETGRKHGLKKVLFASTGGAFYDDDVPFPTQETVVPKPMSPYGISKATIEHYLRFYHQEYGVQYVALRLGNVYGPRQNPFGEAGVVAIFAHHMLKGEPVLINGDGLQTRDYVYVDDVARAFLMATEYEKSTAFHVATANETNVVEIFDAVNKATGANYDHSYGPAKGGEVRRSCLANRKIFEAMQWTPEVKLEQGIEEAVKFFKRQLKDPSAR